MTATVEQVEVFPRVIVSNAPFGKDHLGATRHYRQVSAKHGLLTTIKWKLIDGRCEVIEIARRVLDARTGETLPLEYIQGVFKWGYGGMIEESRVALSETHPEMRESPGEITDEDRARGEAVRGHPYFNTGKSKYRYTPEVCAAFMRYIEEAERIGGQPRVEFIQYAKRKLVEAGVLSEYDSIEALRGLARKVRPVFC